MTASLYVRYMLRESRGSRGRLVFFIVCLAVGVAGVVAVAGLGNGIDEAIRDKAREMLAADLSVSARRPMPTELKQVLGTIPGTSRSDVREFVSVVVAASGPSMGTSRLAELKSVDGPYPYYGKVETDPQGRLADLLGPDKAVVAKTLLAQMHLERGGRLRIGGVDFTVAAVLLKEPDRLEIGLTTLAPRVFLSPEGLDRTKLIRPTSRVTYRALIKLPDGARAKAVEAAARKIEKALPGGAYVRVETYAEAQPALRAALRRMDRFLGLVALLSLLIGGIGVAQTVRSWIAGRIDAIATLRCLGARPREVFLLYLGQAALLGAAGSLAGAGVGTILEWAVPRFMTGVLPVTSVRLWQPAALLRGVGLGVGVALLFSLGPLLAARRVPPVRVFRSDAEPLSAGRRVRAAILLAVLAGVFGTAFVQTDSLAVSAGFTGGGCLLIGLLALAAFGITRLVSRLPMGGARVWLRHGLSALARPGASTLGAIVALGMGVAVVLGMYLIQDRVRARFDQDVPSDAPSLVMADIQPDQWGAVRGLLRKAGATGVDSVPVVNARLRSVDGVSVEDLASRKPDESHERWVLTREQHLTYAERLPEGNTITEGKLWSDPTRAEVSVEKDFARDIGAKVGSVLVLDVLGKPLTLEVTSLRGVKWETYRLNFFLIVEPGVLEDAPQIRFAEARVPPARDQQVQDEMAARFPNVTTLQVRSVLQRVLAVLSRASLGVQALGGLTVVAGIFILAGAVSAGSIRRGREVALLKTIGMTRRGVLAIYSVEYALVGLVAGGIGASGGGVLAYLLLTRFFDVSWRLDAPAFTVALSGAVVLAVAAGTAASASALARKPVEVLRSE